ncbi:Ig-like domain-containing protein [Cellulomonas hominis]
MRLSIATVALGLALALAAPGAAAASAPGPDLEAATTEDAAAGDGSGLVPDPAPEVTAHAPATDVSSYPVPTPDTATVGADLLADDVAGADDTAPTTAAPLAADPVAAQAIAELLEIRTFSVEGGRSTGYSVDLDGDLAAYTGDYVQRSAAGVGSVQVARRTGPTDSDWAVTDIPAPADARGFGAAVQVDAEAGRLVVGARESSQVFVYEQDPDGAWELVRTLTPPTTARITSTTSFGEELALDGDTLLIGAPNATVDRLSSAGAAYVADLESGTITALIPASGSVQGGAILGQAVAVSGHRLVVGAPQYNQRLPFLSATLSFRVGALYIWDLRELAAGPALTVQPITAETKSVPPSSGGGPAFGFALAFVGTTLYVGSPTEVNYTEDLTSPTGGYNSDSINSGTTTEGAVYVYDAADPAQLVQLGGKLIAPAHSWAFGQTLTTDSGNLLVSANNAGDEHRGEVYVYDRGALSTEAPLDAGLGRQYVEPLQVLRGSDMPPAGYFGAGPIGGGLTISGDRVLVGAYTGSASSTGKVYLFAPVGAPLPPVEVGVDVEDVTITYGQQATLRAEVRNAPVGARVTFTVGTAVIGPLELVADAVETTFPPAAHDVATYPVEVSVLDAGSPDLVATGSATLAVLPATTSTSLELVDAGAVDGQPLAVAGVVTGQLGTLPTGSVEVLAGDTVVGTVTVDPSGQYSAVVPGGRVVAGTLTVRARYLGDVNHLASDASHDAAVTAPGPVDPGNPPTPTPTTPPVYVSDVLAAPDAPQGALAETGAAGTLALAGLAGALIAVGLALRARRARA